jgi:hypothetical protein
MRTFLQVTVLCAAGVANHEAAALWFGAACREWQGRFGAPSLLVMRQRHGLEAHQHVNCLWFVLLRVIHMFRNLCTAQRSQVMKVLFIIYICLLQAALSRTCARLWKTLHNGVDERRMIEILPIILD